MNNQNQRSRPFIQCHSSPSHCHLGDSEKAWHAGQSVPLKRDTLYAIVLFGMLLWLLCSCSGAASPAQTPTVTSTTVVSTPAPSPSSASLTQIDWMNHTYTNSCYSNTRPFQVRHGTAVNNGIHFTVYQPYYADLTGDAMPEAIVPYQCSGADTGGKHVLIYSGTAKHPLLLGDLPEAHTSNTIDNVIKISTAQGELHLSGVGYSAGTPRCCPDLSIQNSYRWNGSKFVLLRSVVNKR